MSDLERCETERQRHQIALDSERTARERNRLGQFATPPELARAIARAAVHCLEPDSPLHFGEPSVGSGSFFAALLAENRGRQILSAEAFEVDPRFVEIASRLWKSHGLDVRHADFPATISRGEASTRPNLILANPPYVRHHHLDATIKKKLQAETKRLTGLDVSGLAGLYVYFLLLSDAWMAEGGVAAWLIPSEFLDVNYGSALRQYLSERVTLLHLHRFDASDVQFADALVSSTVVIFKKAVPLTQHCVCFTQGGRLEAASRQRMIPRETLRESLRWSGLLAPVDAVAGTSGPTLGDYFTTRRGIATGANEFFVLPRAQAIRLGLPDTTLRPILPSPRSLPGRLLESDGDGYPCIADPLVLLDCALPESEAMRQIGLWDYLQRGVAQGLPERYLLRQRKPWYRQERREPAPFVCTYMGRGGKNGAAPLRFLLNRSRAIAPNVYLMLYPKPALEVALREPGRDLAALAALETIANQYATAGGRTYGGGLHKIEPGELLRLPAMPLAEVFPEIAPARLTQLTLFPK